MNNLESHKSVEENATEAPITGAVLTSFVDDAPAISTGEKILMRQSLGAIDTSILEFFSRPLKIYTGTNNAFTEISIDVFALYFMNPAVVRKLANYQYIRCTLNLRYSEAYNPYIYGRRYLVNIPNSTYKDYDFPGYTVLKHCCINPTKANTYEMVLPFEKVYGTYYTIPSLITGTGVESTCKLFQPVPYDNSNGGAVDGTYSIHAWLTDVELAVPVGSGTLQSGGMKEYKGMISAPATAISSAAKTLSTIPILKPFMGPIEQAAGMVAKIAVLFGFSKPTNLEAPAPYLWNSDYNSFISASVDPAQRLTLDGKQALAVSTVQYDGESGDNMAFESIIKRDMVVVDEVWTTAYTNDTVLFYIPVTPFIYTPIAANEITLPPVAEVASMFKYWRGSIKFSVSIIASKFHKGRLRFFWSPTRYTIPFTEPISNLVESYIIDINTETDVEFTVHYTAAVPYYKLSPLSMNTAHAEAANPGYFYCLIHQELTAPDSTKDAHVYVSISSEESEFGTPTNLYQNFFLVQPKPESSVELSANVSVYPFIQNTWPPNPSYQSGALTEYAVKPNKYAFNEKSQFADANKLHLGESILSFRTLCKSYMFCERATFPIDAAMLTDYWSYLSFSPYPKMQGLSPASTGIVGLISPRTPLVNLMNSFRYHKGSIRYKIVFNSTENIYEARVCRVRGNGVARYGGTDTGMDVMGRYFLQGVAIDRKNNSIQFEIPYQEQRSMRRNFFLYENLNFDSGFDLGMVAVNRKPGDYFLEADVYMSIGEDFNVMYYIGSQ